MSTIYTIHVGNSPPTLDLSRTGIRPFGSDTGTVDSLCFANRPGGYLVVVDCHGVDGTFDSREWHVNGALDQEEGPTFVVDRGGNFTCTLINSCGRTVFPVLFPTSK